MSNPSVNLSVIDITNYTLSISEFREMFAGIYSDPVVYTDTAIRNVIWLAAMEVSKCAMRGYYKIATYFLAAHFLWIFRQAQDGEENEPGSGIGATTLGMTTSTSVGDLSLTKEFPAYINPDDTFLATTWYGQQFIRYRNKMSHGPMLTRELVLNMSECSPVEQNIVIID